MKPGMPYNPYSPQLRVLISHPAYSDSTPQQSTNATPARRGMTARCRCISEPANPSTNGSRN